MQLVGLFHKIHMESPSARYATDNSLPAFEELWVSLGSILLLKEPSYAKLLDFLKSESVISRIVSAYFERTFIPPDRSPPKLLRKLYKSRVLMWGFGVQFVI